MRNVLVVAYVIVVAGTLGCGDKTGASPADGSVMGFPDINVMVDGAPTPDLAQRDIAYKSTDLAYMSHWNGDCCGLKCKPGQFCVNESDGAPQCQKLPDGGICTTPGICGTSCQGQNSPGCPTSHHAACVDFPPSCIANPTCGCLTPLVEGDHSGNCHQHCDDSMLESAGVIRFRGLKGTVLSNSLVSQSEWRSLQRAA